MMEPFHGANKYKQRPYILNTLSGLFDVFQTGDGISLLCVFTVEGL